MRLLPRFLILLTWLLSGASHAFTAVASVEGHALSTIYAALNQPTQKKADLIALDGCRTKAGKNGISKKASKCVIFHRQKGPGGGAIVCGERGCLAHTGSDTEQIAVDTAIDECEQHNYVNCQKEDITSWWDDVGYPKQTAKNVAPTKACGPPPGRTVHSTYHCNNADCTRTFENGCTVRFQAPYCFDPINGRWDWKPEGC